MPTITDILELLQEQEIPVEVVRQVGNLATIVYKPEATKAQKTAGDQIAADNPLSKPEEQHIIDELDKQNISDHKMLMALWDKVMNNKTAKADEINSALAAICLDLGQN